MPLLFPTSVGILERSDFTSMYLWLGGCVYVHTGVLQALSLCCLSASTF